MPLFKNSNFTPAAPVFGVRENGTEALLLILAVVAGILLRLHGLKNQAFSYDEIALYIYSLTGSMHGANQEAPLMAWLLYAWFWLLRSTTDYVAHLLPALIGTLVIPAAWLLAKTVYDRKVAVITAWLVALSPTFIYYSQIARPYALFLLLTTLLYWCFLRAWNSFSIGRWALYAVLMALCFATHALAAQVAAALGIVAVASTLYERSLPAWRNFACFCAASAVSGIGASWVFMRGSAVTSVLNGHYRHGIIHYFIDLLPSLGLGSHVISWISLPMFMFGAMLPATLAAIGLLFLVRRNTMPAAFLFPVLIAVTLSVAYLTLGSKGNWTNWPRYICHIYVPFAILVAGGVAGIISAAAHPRVTGSCLAALFVIALFLGLTHWATKPNAGTGGIATFQATQYINAHQGSLQSVVIRPSTYWTYHGIDDRMTNIYMYYRRNALPVLQLVDGHLKRIRFISSRGGLTRVALVDQASQVAPTSGRIAIISFQRLKSCAQFAGLLHTSPVITVKHQLRVGRLTVCDIDTTDS